MYKHVLNFFKIKIKILGATNMNAMYIDIECIRASRVLCFLYENTFAYQLYHMCLRISRFYG
jgi:hypothetical protein